MESSMNKLGSGGMFTKLDILSKTMQKAINRAIKVYGTELKQTMHKTLKIDLTIMG